MKYTGQLGYGDIVERGSASSGFEKIRRGKELNLSSLFIILSFSLHYLPSLFNIFYDFI